MDPKTFETDKLEIASYLDLKGLKYLGSRIGEGRGGKKVVIFTFEDEKNQALDLERSYRQSKEKQYRELLLFYRNEIYRLTD